MADERSAKKRREEIIALLKKSEAPISASALASRFSVSRQLIVGDIALLRAAGSDISATPRGYVLTRGAEGLRRTLACVHSCEQTEQELNIIVDNGCTVLDVIVEHELYGQISGKLELSSRYDVAQFIAKLGSDTAPPLSSLTSGVHLHTLLCPNEEAYQRVCESLRGVGILLE